MGGSSLTVLTIAALVVLSGADSDQGYELLVTSAGADVERTCFDIPPLHPSATGTYFISGPAKFEMGGFAFRSYFDGYARANRFELEQGKVCFTAKFLNTTYLRQAEKAGRIEHGPIFYGVDPPLPRCSHLRDPMCSVRGAEMDNNWVNLLPLPGSEGLLLNDSPVFVRFNYETLAVGGMYPWKHGGPMGMVPSWLKPFHFPFLGSAHPVLRPGTPSTYVALLLEMSILPLSKDAVAIYNIDTETMERTLLTHVPMDGLQYFHSYGVTENYVVLPMNLLFGKPESSTELFTGFKDGWNGIRVVDNHGSIQVFNTTKFFHVHIANTFENETGIVMDLGTFRNLPFSPHIFDTRDFLNKTLRDDPANGNDVERVHLHLAGAQKGQVTRQVLSPRGRMTDFFKINDARNGLSYCIYYALEWFHHGSDYASMAILKHDICQNKRSYWSKHQSYPSEPHFIPTGDGGKDGTVEDQGLIVFVTLDGKRKASDLVVLCAQSFKELAVVKLPVHIPFLAHGQFIPKATREAVRVAVEDKHPDVAVAMEEANLLI